MIPDRYRPPVSGPMETCFPLQNRQTLTYCLIWHDARYRLSVDQSNVNLPLCRATCTSSLRWGISHPLLTWGIATRNRCSVSKILSCGFVPDSRKRFIAVRIFISYRTNITCVLFADPILSRRSYGVNESCPRQWWLFSLVIRNVSKEIRFR